MKIAGKVATGLLVLSLPLLLLSASIAGAFNCRGLYRYGFQKYGISQATGLAPAELDKAAAGLIGYFNSGEADISLTVIKDGQPFVLFNPREVAHLRDVKGLVWLDYRIALITLAYALAFAIFSLFRRRHRRLARAVLWGSGLTLGLMLALGVGALADFGPLFWQFHLISFSNDFWQLDPARDYLIMMFPGGFWQDAVLFIVLAAVAGAVILGGAAAGHLKFRRGWAGR